MSGTLSRVRTEFDQCDECQRPPTSSTTELQASGHGALAISCVDADWQVTPSDAAIRLHRAAGCVLLPASSANNVCRC